jgi:hypothetical protein
MQDSEFELLTALGLCITGSVTREDPASDRFGFRSQEPVIDGRGDLTSRFSDTRPRLPQLAVRSSPAYQPSHHPTSGHVGRITAGHAPTKEPRAESATWRSSGVSPVSGRRLLSSARGGFRAAMSTGIRSAIGYPVLSFDLGRLRRIRRRCAREPSE